MDIQGSAGIDKCSGSGAIGELNPYHTLVAHNLSGWGGRLVFCFCQRSIIPASPFSEVVAWWKRGPLLTNCLGFGCCPLLPWSQEEEGPGVQELLVEHPYGVRVCKHPTGRAPLPVCRILVTNAVSVSRTGLVPALGFPVPLASSGLPCPYPPPKRGIQLSHFICTKHHVLFKPGLWGYSCIVTCYN